MAMIYPIPASTNVANGYVAPLFIPDIVVEDLSSKTRRSTRLGGVVDTGAQRTIIPLHLAVALQMICVGAVRARTFDSSLKSKSYPVYYVLLTLPGLRPKDLEVIGCVRNEILLGRDI